MVQINDVITIIKLVLDTIGNVAMMIVAVVFLIWALLGGTISVQLNGLAETMGWITKWFK